MADDYDGTPEERVTQGLGDAMADRTTNLMVGAPPPAVATTGTATGQFTFTNLHELNDVLTGVKALYARVQDRGQRIGTIIGLIRAPAEDETSRRQAAETITSLRRAQQHNDAMGANLDGYIQALEDARSVMVSTDNENRRRMTDVGKG